MIQRLLLAQLGSCLVFLALSLVFAPHQFPGIALGGAIIFADIAVIWWAFYEIFFKKRIALAGGVIVVKYAILVAIIFLSIQRQWVPVIGFCVGIATVLPALLLFALWPAGLLGDGSED